VNPAQSYPLLLIWPVVLEFSHHCRCLTHFYSLPQRHHVWVPPFKAINALDLRFSKNLAPLARVLVALTRMSLYRQIIPTFITCTRFSPLSECFLGKSSLPYYHGTSYYPKFPLLLHVRWSECIQSFENAITSHRVGQEYWLEYIIECLDGAPTATAFRGRSAQPSCLFTGNHENCYTEYAR